MVDDVESAGGRCPAGVLDEVGFRRLVVRQELDHGAARREDGRQLEFLGAAWCVLARGQQGTCAARGATGVLGEQAQGRDIRGLL